MKVIGALADLLMNERVSESLTYVVVMRDIGLILFMKQSMERKELKTVSLNSSACLRSLTMPSPSIGSISSSSSALIVSNLSFNASFKHDKFCVIGMFASYKFVNLLYYLRGGSLVRSSNSFLFCEFVSHY